LRTLRAIATGVLVAAVLMVGLLPAAAQAAGPGVTLYVNTQPRPVDIPGGRFAGGVPLQSLLQAARIDVTTVAFVTVARPDGGLITLRRGDIAGAQISDNGTTTRFVRGGGTSVSATVSDGPLQINVNSGDISVIASVDRSNVNAGTGVTFSADVRFAPPGAQLTYRWDFGDGSPPKTGRTIKHVYRDGNNYQARVSVTGSGGSTQRCATYCAGTDAVDVTVGDPPQQPKSATPSPGAGTGDPNAAGSATGTGGGGQGGSGGSGAGTGSDPSGTTDPAAAAKPKPKPKPQPPKRPFGVTISGVLINDAGTTVEKLPAGKAAGAPKGQRQTAGSGSDTGIEVPLSGLLAVTLISLGALRERRGVRLRLA
jgi:PKD domain